MTPTVTTRKTSISKSVINVQPYSTNIIPDNLLVLKLSARLRIAISKTFRSFNFESRPTTDKMRSLIFGLIFFHIAQRDISVTACSGKPIVPTLAGKVQGSRQRGVEGNEFCAFKGIPYAKPPVAELRFRVRKICKFSKRI